MAEIGIFVGTMYGNSLLVAEEAEAILTAQGHKATVFEDPELSDWLPYQDKYVLVVTSTTGQLSLIHIFLRQALRESFDAIVLV